MPRDNWREDRDRPMSREEAGHLGGMARARESDEESRRRGVMTRSEASREGGRARGGGGGGGRMSDRDVTVHRERTEDGTRITIETHNRH